MTQSVDEQKQKAPVSIRLPKKLENKIRKAGKSAGRTPHSIMLGILNWFSNERGLSVEVVNDVCVKYCNEFPRGSI